MAREILKATKSALESNKARRKLGSYGTTLAILLNFGLKDIEEGVFDDETLEFMTNGMEIAKVYDKTCCRERYQSVLDKSIHGLAYLSNRRSLARGSLDEIKVAVAVHEAQLKVMTAAELVQTLAIIGKEKANHV